MEVVVANVCITFCFGGQTVGQLYMITTRRREKARRLAFAVLLAMAETAAPREVWIWEAQSMTTDKREDTRFPIWRLAVAWLRISYVSDFKTAYERDANMIWKDQKTSDLYYNHTQKSHLSHFSLEMRT